MKKARIEAFTDAVVAIILTIMVLEIKVPEEASDISSLLESAPYFIAFLISFIFICTAWYHHHFLLSQTKWFSRRAFWANNLWLLTMALIPVATAWVSEFPLEGVPEYFYFIVYVIWAGSYYLLNFVLFLDNNKPQSLSFKNPERSLLKYFDLLLLIVGIIGIYFIPIMGLLIATVQIVLWNIFSPKNSDKTEII